MSEPPAIYASRRLADFVRDVCEAHTTTKGSLLPILHDVQSQLGYIPPESIQLIANELNLSRADVYGVITFYKDFRETQPGRVTVRVCRAEACQAVGAEALVEHACRQYGVLPDATSADGSVTLDQVFCFGNCALGPTAEVAGKLYGRVTPSRLDALIAANIDDGVRR